MVLLGAGNVLAFFQMAPVGKGKKKKKNEEPSRRFAYSEEALKSALSDIRGNIRSIREACRLYQVPRSTVQDRLSGRVADQKRKVGPDPIFGFDGEKKIVDWIIELAKAGIPINKYDLLDTVAELAKDLDINHRFPGGKPGIRWYLSFLKRHPNISIREPEAINKAREAIKERSIRKWFSDLHTFLVERNALDILDDPSRILNADETGVSLSPKSGKVLAPKGYKNVYVVKNGNEKENITVLIVMTAAGEICPPLVVYPYIRPPKAVVDSMPPDWILGKSETGWMRSDTFFEYMSNGFNDWLTKQNVKKPVLFFVDGHKSHMSMPLSKFCEDNDIILYALPPNTTHILQPADVSVFKPLKQEWKRTVKNWQSRPENLNKCITKTNFCQVFKETLGMEMTQTIKNGFRKCGLYPFDVEQVDFTKCVKDAQIRNTIAQTSSEKPLNDRHFAIARKVFCLMEENISKLGINPGIILRELDRIKEAYLQKRRSKSKTPRTSQASSTARRSKSLEVNKSSNSLRTSRSSSILRHSKSFEDNLAPNKTPTARPSQSGSILEDSIISFEVTGPSDMISKKTRGSIQPSTSTPRQSESFDLQNPSDKPSSERPKTSGFFSNQDMDHGSLPIPDIGSYVSLNDISIAPFSDIHFSEICKASKDIVLPFNDSPTIDVIQIETVAELHQVPYSEISKIDDLDAIETLNSTGSLNYEPGTASSLEVTENIVIATAPETPATPVDEDPFKRHLKFPNNATKYKGTRLSNQFPSAITSKAWQEYYNNKEKAKQDKENQIKKRKLERELKRKMPPPKKKRTKKKKVEEPISPIKCGSCDVDLFSDTEEEGEKNIGCDHCIRWYHLKCTNLTNLSYHQAASAPYKCMLCETAENARRDVLKTYNNNLTD